MQEGRPLSLLPVLLPRPWSPFLHTHTPARTLTEPPPQGSFSSPGTDTYRNGCAHWGVSGETRTEGDRLSGLFVSSVQWGLGGERGLAARKVLNIAA